MLLSFILLIGLLNDNFLCSFDWFECLVHVGIVEVVLAALVPVVVDVGDSHVHRVHKLLVHAELVLQLFLDELAFDGPGTKAFGDEVVGETNELTISLLNLLVLRVKDDRLLDLLDALALDMFVVTDA